MKVRLKGVKKAVITGGYIKLDALLKYVSLASTGGEAKLMVSDGNVSVNGDVCTQRGRKVRPGDIVRCGEYRVIVGAAPERNGR